MLLMRLPSLRSTAQSLQAIVKGLRWLLLLRGGQWGAPALRSMRSRQGRLLPLHSRAPTAAASGLPTPPRLLLRPGLRRRNLRPLPYQPQQQRLHRRQLPWPAVARLAVAGAVRVRTTPCAGSSWRHTSAAVSRRSSPALPLRLPPPPLPPPRLSTTSPSCTRGTRATTRARPLPPLALLLLPRQVQVLSRLRL